jgi:hypothetical protein
VIARTNRIQIFESDAIPGRVAAVRTADGIFITRDDTIYVADSESGPDTGAHELAGFKKRRPHRQREGRPRDGVHRGHESTAPDHSGAEGVGVDRDGNVYGAVVRVKCSSVTCQRVDNAPCRPDLQVRQQAA